MPSADSNWCKQPFDKDHTMCKYSACPQPSCGDVDFTGITDQVIRQKRFSM